jgi:cell division protein FtsN
LSLNPNAAPSRAAPAPAPAAPAGTASVAPQASAAASTGGGAGSYVQVSSQRSEGEAQAAFRSLQAKFPDQLGSRQSSIHKVDLGAKGTYYRAMVGPFANAGEASQLCSSLKAAGGQCLVQRN